MNQLVLLYAQRKRQIVVIMATVAIFAVIMLVQTWQQLPRAYNIQSANDGHSLGLVAQEWPPLPPNAAFILSRSADGAGFSPAIERSGFVIGLAAQRGRTYVLFLDHTLLSLGEKADDWVSVRWPLGWTPLGIGAVDNNLVAFGQGSDRTKLLTAVFDNATWRNAAAYPLAADNMLSILTVPSPGGPTVAWVEAKLPPPGAKRTPAQEQAAIPCRVGLARITGDNLAVLPRLDFDRPILMSFVGDNAGVHLYYQKVLTGSPLTFGEYSWPMRDYDPVLRVSTFADGRWSEPRNLPHTGVSAMSAGEFLAASFGGKTFIYSDEYFLGVFYAGTWGRELRGSALSEPFLAMAPTPDSLSFEITRGAAALGLLCIFLGSLVAFALVRRHPAAPLPADPLYAAVSDRAMAAAVDFGMLYFVFLIFDTSNDPFGFWGTLAVFFVVYGSLLEATSGGQTLGKRIFGLRVVDARTLGPITFSSALSRNIFKLIEMLTVGAGCCLSTRRFQRPGDFLASTIVLKELPKFMESDS